MVISADLHLHSCLSPGTSLDMHPQNLAMALLRNKVNLACLTDYNSTMNVPAFYMLCKKYNVPSLYGMEAQTAECVHALVLFNNPVTAFEFGLEWQRHLFFINDKTEQIYVNEKGEMLGSIEKNLLCNSDVSIFELASMVHEHSGLIIPSRVDSKNFSFMSQFEKILRGPWDALEFENIKDAPKLLPCPYPVLKASPVDFITDVGFHSVKLDIENEELVTSESLVNLLAIQKAFEKLVILPEGLSSSDSLNSQYA